MIPYADVITLLNSPRGLLFFYMLQVHLMGRIDETENVITETIDGDGYGC